MCVLEVRGMKFIISDHIWPRTEPLCWGCFHIVFKSKCGISMNLSSVTPYWSANTTISNYNINKLTSVFYVSVLSLMMNFVKTLSKFSGEITRLQLMISTTTLTKL